MSLPPRRFVHLSRTVHQRHSAYGSHTLDAIDEDGRAWWLILGVDEAPTEWTELKPLPPRRFVSISRTVHQRHSAYGSHTLDAIDEDGRAWWLILGVDEAPTEWTELKPLPSREDRP